jgi:hypothetical protein
VGNYFQSLDGAVEFQRGAEGQEEYRVVDLLVEHVQGKGGTYKGMMFRYQANRSLFLHSRAPLPSIRVNFRPTRDTTVGKLTIEDVLVLVKGVGLREQAIYLSLLQGFLDRKRFFDYLNPHGFELGQHIQTRGVDESYRVNVLRGRKTNPMPFNTWLGRDALQAWQLYFDRERGYPKPGEAAALDQFGKPLTSTGLYSLHMYNLRKLKFVKGYSHGNSAARYGYNLHEFRDVARSEVERAVTVGFNTNSAEFWMGHMEEVDPLFYAKIWSKNQDYNLEQYQIAMKYLNIVSGPQLGSEQDQEKIKTLEEKMAIMSDMLNGVAGALEKLGIKWIESKDTRIFDLGKGKFIVQDKEESIR